MYVCFSNVNFINTMIIMKKIIYLVLLALITGLVAQAHEKTGEWNGCDRYDFTFKDRQATIVVPKKAAKGNPWIWRPAFFDAFPSVDKALLEKGFHIVYYDVTHLYGSPRAVSLGTEFYENMTDLYNLSEKVTLEGNPIDNLAPIAAAGIPIISVCGDSDQTVPYKENMDVVRSRYLAAGGPVEVILKKGCDHHPHSLDNPEPVVDFILRQQPEYEKYIHYNVRGSLQNSFRKFEKERRARVAFLGGSITEMDGWRNMIERQLQQRFPYTQFEWVEAGIGSTGTTPGSFRLQHDILSKGKVDLLFVEAAVNDDTNGFSALEQIRGMEGEVRHALESNPEMDIVMLHFIYDPFIPMIARRQMPDVILNHERVANHYLIPSINLCQEIGERMQNGEFTWDEFGGTHPKPFGHKFYAAAIGHLFDEMWKGVSPEGTIAAHDIPAKPLDAYSYYNGDFIALEKAHLNKGWKLVDNWHPDNKAGKRNGFVDVPMLEATRPGDRLTLDFRGKAIGIFCVSGPSAGILEYSVDGAPFKELDTFTEWSHNLYIPWVYMLETELKDTDHKLVLRISKKKNPASQGTECQIRNFVVNGR